MDTRRAVDTTTTAAAAVQRLARELLPQAISLASQVSEQVLQRVPELAPSADAGLVQAVYDSTEQNVGAIIATLAYGMAPTAIEPPAGTRDLVDRILVAGGELTDFVRGYHVGQDHLRKLWSEHVYRSLSDAEQIRHVLELSCAHIFTFIDEACRSLAEDNRDTLTERRGARRTATPPHLVRRVLSSDVLNIEEVSAELGYEIGAGTPPFGTSCGPHRRWQHTTRPRRCHA